MRELVALVMPGGPAILSAIDRAWAEGDAVFPIDPNLPPAARSQLADEMGATLLDEGGSDRERLPGRPVEEGDALVIATSGTTASPRGVVHTHASLAAAAAATSAALEVDPSRDSWLCFLPLSHMAGMAMVSRSRWSGAGIEVIPRFERRALEEAVGRGATLASLVPALLGRVDTDLFRRVLVGGSRPPRDLPDNVIATYGSTETGGGVVYDGLALPGVEVRIDAGGEILLRTPTMARAIRDGQPIVDDDGWWRTGDLGRFEGGRLEVLGRVDEIIVTGGENVSPIQVEEVLLRHPLVREVAVVGRPEPTWGAIVTAVVVPADGARPPVLEELRALASEHLPSASWPRGLEVVSNLPRTALGKVRRSVV